MRDLHRDRLAHKEMKCKSSLILKTLMLIFAEARDLAEAAEGRQGRIRRAALRTKSHAQGNILSFVLSTPWIAIGTCVFIANANLKPA